YPGVMVFLAICAALGGALLWRASFLLTHNSDAAWFAWASCALTVPFFFQSFAVYPDPVGATLVLFCAIPLLAEQQVSTRRLLATGVGLALLPWLHTRFAVLAAALGLV